MIFILLIPLSAIICALIVGARHGSAEKRMCKQAEDSIRLDMLCLQSSGVLAACKAQRIIDYKLGGCFSEDWAVVVKEGEFTCYHRQGDGQWHTKQSDIIYSVLDVHGDNHQVPGYKGLPESTVAEYLSYAIPGYVRHTAVTA